MSAQCWVSPVYVQCFNLGNHSRNRLDMAMITIQAKHSRPSDVFGCKYDIISMQALLAPDAAQRGGIRSTHNASSDRFKVQTLRLPTPTASTATRPMLAGVLLRQMARRLVLWKVVSTSMS
ncbi:hypothetical protein DPSP01_008222 [Paraphaeosphaeria sporulosa]